MSSRQPQVQKILEGDARPGSEIITSDGSRFIDVPEFIKRDSVACQVFREVADYLAETGQLAKIDAIQLANYAVLQSYFIAYYRNTGMPSKDPTILSNIRAYSKMFTLDPFHRATMALRPGADEENKADRLRRRMSGDE